MITLNILILLLLMSITSCGMQEPQTITISAHSSFSSHRWSNSSFPLNIAVDQDRYVEGSQDRAALDFAAYRWNRALGFEAIILNYRDISPTLTYTDMNQYGKDHLYTTNEPDLSPDHFMKNDVMSLAMTVYTYRTDTNEILHGDIFFNRHLDISTNVVGEYDLESVYIHELGHFLGLSHTEEEEDYDSVMTPSIVPSQLKRELTEGDITRIRNLYD